MIGRREFIGASLASACGAPLLAKAPSPSETLEDAVAKLPPVIGPDGTEHRFKTHLGHCAYVMLVGDGSIDAIREYAKDHSGLGVFFGEWWGFGECSGNKMCSALVCAQSQQAATEAVCTFQWGMIEQRAISQMHANRGSIKSGASRLVDLLDKIKRPAWCNSGWILVSSGGGFHLDSPEARCRHIVAAILYDRRIHQKDSWLSTELSCRQHGVAFSATTQPMRYWEGDTYVIVSLEQEGCEWVRDMLVTTPKTHIAETETHAVK